jgi:hypothetical protein
MPTSAEVTTYHHLPESAANSIAYRARPNDAILIAVPLEAERAMIFICIPLN